jgi:RimJ/RimL family protein N-acetyltransferase
VEPVTLETERLVLRSYRSSDADSVYTACQDPDIQYYTPVPAPYRIADARKHVEQTCPDGWATDRDYILAGFRIDDGSHVGECCLTKRETGVYELGYWAVREQRGRGYTAEAARALCRWGFDTLAAHRLEWWAMVGNVASRALAERLGFTLEGTLRSRSLVNGVPHDWWVGGLLYSEAALGRINAGAAEQKAEK